MEILRLKIFSKNIEKQGLFYQEKLGLPLLKKTSQAIHFQIGNSILEIQEKLHATPYHFAINIPSNQEDQALNWLKERVAILKDVDAEIQDFDFWNAKAIYFYDADNNIVEFIARKNLANSSDKAFSIDSLLEISEIGVPTNNIEQVYQQINTLTDLEIYDGNLERFCAIGDEHGLFIAINKNVKDWFPTNDKAYTSEFEMELLANKQVYNLTYKNGQIIQ